MKDTTRKRTHFLRHLSKVEALKFKFVVVSEFIYIMFNKAYMSVCCYVHM